MTGKMMTSPTQSRTGKTLEKIQWHLDEVRFYKDYLKQTNNSEAVWRIIELDYQAIKKLKNELLCQN